MARSLVFVFEFFGIIVVGESILFEFLFYRVENGRLERGERFRRSG